MPADPMVAEGTLGKPAPMRITTISGAVVVMILAASAPARAAERGTLLRGERMTRLSRSQTARQVARLTLPVRQVRHGVDAFRLRYATVGVGGAPTSASGLLVLPRVRARRLRTVSYAHGTMVVRADAPSRSLDSLAGASALLFAGAGFATVAPDYLGLGDGPGRHPLVHAKAKLRLRWTCCAPPTPSRPATTARSMPTRW